MNRTLVGYLGIFAAFFIAAGHASAQEKNDGALALEYDRVVRPVLAKYCNSCHTAPKPKGGIDLASRKGNELPEDWKEVWQRLRSRQMPPSGKPQPTASERERLRSEERRVGKECRS